MPLVVRAVARSHVGLVRSANEDSGYAGESLFVIADGMGGHAAGEVASRTVVAAMLGLDGADLGPDMGTTLRHAVAEANDRLRVAVDARPDLDGMGTTMTALAWDGARLGLVHIGDSRAYLLRGRRLRLLTHDQTLVQSLVDDGRITADEARTHPQRSVILQALDGRPDLDPDVELLDPEAGDRFLICSDGLTGYVDESSVAAVLQANEARAAVDGLIGLALEAGAPDNVTVILVDVLEVARADAPDDSRDAATHAPGGVLVGAVGETAAAATVVETDAAAPEGRPTNRPAGTAAEAGATLAPDSEPERPERRRRRRWPWLVGLVLALVAVGAVAAWTWAQDQWYVGVESGNVAVFSGVDVTLGPLVLSRLSERTTLEAVTLPEYARAEVEAGITASSREDATAIVARLQSAVAACLNAPETAGCP